MQHLRLFIAGCLFVLLSTVAFAQTRVVSGMVREPGGITLPGVSVVVKGTTTGTQTDANGSYKLTVPDNATLSFSFIGKTSQDIAVGTRTAIDVSLADDAKSLNEVVVVGYGTQRKKDLTGSIATISATDFQKGNIVNPEQLIAGKLAGVSITPPSGQPGGGSSIRIRGGSSLNASNDPLIVIDGLPVDNNGITGASNPLSLVNPQDIETFTVLKDASAAAIYGARAANGVILITTKKGIANDQLRVSISGLGSVSSIIKPVSVLDADQFRDVINRTGNASQKALLGTANTNWQDQIYRTAFSGDVNAAVTGSIKGMPFRVSAGYLNQSGILKTSNFERFSGSFGISPRFFDNHLRVDVNLKGTLINNVFADQGAIGAAVSFDPTQPVYSGKELYGGYFEWIDPATGKPNTLATRNPLGLLQQRTDKSTVKRSIGNAQFDYKFHFLPELRANLNLGYDVSSSDGTIFVPATAASQFNRGGQNNIYTQSRTNKTLEFYLNYVKDLRKISSRVDLTAGYSYQDFIRENPSYPDNLASGKEFAPAGVPFKTQYTLLAFFGRANYTFKDRYTLTATLRRDATSRFSPNTRWGWFPSVGASWNVKEESFLKNSSAVSALKFRVGYGVTGQQDLPSGLSDYPYLPRYTFSDQTAQYQFGNTFYRTLRAEGYDANIKWEQTESVNAAVDYGFLGGRISGSIDVYQKKTKDLLSVIPVPAGSNLTNQILTNVGNLENKGVEFTINTIPVESKDLTVNVGFNVTYNQNKITNLSKVPTPNDPGILVGGISGGVGNTVQIQTVGFPTNSFYVLQQVYDAAGKPLEGVYVDRNNDGKITIDDRYRNETANPRVFLGFTGQVSYKRFQAGFVIRGNFDNYVYNNTQSGNGAYRNFTNALGFNGNGSPNVLATNFVNNQYFSDYYVQNGSFLRMDNANVGYDFGKLLGAKTDLKLSLTAQNVFLITKYKGLDPEISNGIDNNFYPRPRIISLGVNLNF
ncbi:MAG: SusC/RagA family TonB-linked outer membrane protein [Spirosoma sp.]|nr:SusC/RagA family TonB-linked outer membrane protein [Spirosoma sp.]